MHHTKDRGTAYNRIARTRVARSALPLLGACWIAITSVRTAQAQVVSSDTARVRAPASHFTGTLPFTVRVLGDGPPVVLIPGLTNTGDVWNATVDSLATQYRCHVLSLAGFGGTPPVATDSTWLPRMRDAIIAYIRLQPLDKPILIGHSLGGHLALDIAATAPDLPRAVINVDGLPFLAAASLNGGGTVERVRPLANQMRQQMRMAPPMPDAMMDAQLRSLVRDTSHLPMLRAMQRASDPATVAEAMFGLYTTDLRPALARIRVPVLNLHAWVAYRPYGQTRAGVETMLADQYATLARHTTRISDTGHHFLMLDEPAWFLQEVRAFLGAR